MGITRFNSFDEAERALWEYNPDNEYFERVRGIFELAERLLPLKGEPGIKKYRSFEERAALLDTF